MKLYVAVFIGVMCELAASKVTWACQSDSDCKGDRICDAGKCAAPSRAAVACKQDTDCQGAGVCEQSVCVPPATPQSAGAAPAPAAPAPVAAAPVAPAPEMPAMTTALAAPLPAPMPASAPMPAPTETRAPAEAPPAASQPTAATPPPAAPPAGPAATTRSHPPAAGQDGATYYKSLTLLVPNVDNFYGVSAHMEQKISSMSSLIWAPTIGALYEGIFYTGGGGVNAYTQTFGVTMGLRPAPPMFLSFAVRGGAMLMLSHMEVGNQKSDKFDGALMAGADLMIGYLVVGAEVWVRNDSLWMGRAGFAW
jgi:hypothetical protein